MIGKVVRGSDVGGLLRYLWGPGRANEHTDPHLVAGWDGDDAAHLEPAASEKYAAGFDTRGLERLLRQPLVAADAGEGSVWHCSLRAAPEDRRLTDGEWSEVVGEVMERTGLAEAGCRWVAVRHAEDHVHLVVTLAGEDGRKVSPHNDYYRLGEACRTMEERLGLRRTGARDRTAPTRPTRGEAEKAQRAGRDEPPRTTLRREVRVARDGAGDVDEFLDRLRAAGVMVRVRESELHPGEVTGYAVAWPGDVTADGDPVWYGGSKLAADLSWPKISADLEHATGAPASTMVGSSRGEGGDVWQQAVDVLDRLDDQDLDDPDVTAALSTLLTVASRSLDGHRVGAVTRAADDLDRARRQPWSATAPRTSSGDGIRTAARALTKAGRASRSDAVKIAAVLLRLAVIAHRLSRSSQFSGRPEASRAAVRVSDQVREVAAGMVPDAPAPPARHPDPQRDDRRRRR